MTIHDGPRGPFLIDSELATLKFAIDSGLNVTGHVELGGVRAERARIASLSNISPYAESCLAIANSLYVGPFRNAISVGAGQQYYDLQIGTGFVSSFAEYKSGVNPEHNEAVVRLVEEIRRIFGYRSLEISPTADKTSLQVIADGRSFRLSELGSGLAHFIVVLVNTLIAEPPFLLIDEPELNLHAALQLDFLSALTKATQYGVVFATHSLGLARSSADHLALVSRTKGSVSVVRPYEGHQDLPSLAAQLGFDGHPELGFERVLLVEGKSEVRTSLQLLRLYGKEHRIALVPLGGGELIHKNSDVELRELMRLGPVSYLIDSERSSDVSPAAPKHQDFVDLCVSLGINGHMLNRRALENYLPQHAVTSAFGEGRVALGPYEKSAGSGGWPKTQNWRVAAEMSAADLEDTDLGAFLASL